MKCIKCSSYAVNHHLHGRDGTDPDLCDVCFWRKRAEQPAQPQQEPVAEVIGRTKLENESVALTPRIIAIDQSLQTGTLLYASPPAQRTWVGLTDIEYDNICGRHSAMTDFDFLEDIEAKLKEKNT